MAETFTQLQLPEVPKPTEPIPTQSPLVGDAYEGDRHPSYHEPVSLPTPQESKVGKLGVEQGLAILKNTKPPTA